MLVVAGYVRRSSEMQKDNYSIDAQKRAIRDAARLRGLPEPIFYEDDERSARGEQIAKRPDFKRLLDDVQAGRIQVIFVHTLDRWSRNVMVTLQSFRILSEYRTAFISLSEHIDYSTPEGRLQLTILAAFAAYFSDMLAKHTSKGKSERVAQGLYNGDIPFGYRSTGSKLPPEFDPEEYPGLRLLGELRMKGIEADKIADALNEAGYRTGSKRFGARLFNKDTVSAMLKNEFYAAFAPGDDRGTVKYKDQRFRGLHPAVFTYDEWQKIRSMTQSLYRASTRTEQVKHVYQFAGYISCIHCGLKLRCDTGNTPDNRRQYYRDAAKARRMPCPTGGNLMIRIDTVDAHFGELLKRLVLPENWREIIRQKMVAEALKAGVTPENIEREKERLKLKKARTIKLYREGYIEEEEFQGEMAAVELAIKQLDAPEVDGVTYDEVIEAGEHLPGMAALWDVATVEERYEMVTIILEPGGLYYDLENKIIAAIKPRPAFLPVLRMLNGVMEFDETRGLLVTEHWCERNRRATNHRSHLALIPLEKLFPDRTDILVYRHPTYELLDSPEPSPLPQRRPGPDNPQWKIPPSEWPTVLRRVEQNHEPLRQVAKTYGVSYEAVRRVLRAARRQENV
jgi:DNA invertase Pin-like site-specific DNA recombinase